jgi:antitoxin component YwqK of YwqJK toxin-antitoxin module/Tfp pilus assembly protein PilF
MKIFHYLPVLLLPFLHCSVLQSQTDSLQFKTSLELIEIANRLHDGGDYASAITVLKRVGRTDPQYAAACYEMALSHYYADNLFMAMEKCREAEFLHYDQPHLIGLMASIRDDSGDPAGGIELLSKALQTWPYNQNLLYNLGICLLSNNQPDKAESVLVNSIRCDPYHAKSHLALAKANFTMGRIAQAYLAWCMGTLINPSATHVREYENAISGKSSIIPRPYKYPYPEGFNHRKWDELTWLLQSEFAFKEGFAFDYDLNYTITRQSFMLISNLKYDPADTSLYNRLYTRILSGILQTGQFEAYLYYLLKNLGNAEVDAWIGNNNDRINGFITWAQGFLNSGRSYGFSPENQSQGIKRYQFNGEGVLSAIGESSGENIIRTGPWIELNSNGGISERGTYRDDKSEGEWLIYWNNGKVKQRLQFRNGLLDGLCYTYYPNGAQEGIYPMKEGLKNGIIELFTASGLPLSSNTYYENRLDGRGTYYNYAGSFSREFNYSNDTLTGSFTEKWLNGAPKLECYYENGLYNGSYRTWYANGKPESECTYAAGIKVGKWYNYHFIGKLKEEGENDAEGNLVGEFRSYDREGRLVSVEKDYVDGLLSGAYTDYFENGKEQVRRTYVKDTLTAIACFDEKGNLLHQDVAKGNAIYYKSFYPDGILRIEGMLDGGKRQGNWKWYNPLGILEDDLWYKDGMTSGKQQSYYANGVLKEVYESDSSNIIGRYNEYNINGHLRASGIYNKQGLNGEYVTWFANDSVAARSFYTGGTLTGRSITFNPAGKVTVQEFYNEEGQSVRTLHHGPDGFLFADLDYEYAPLAVETAFENGQPRTRSKIVDHRMHGTAESFFPNGSTASRSTYIYGKEDGISQAWDYNGNKTLEFGYLLGTPEGPCTWFDQGLPDFRAMNENGLYQGKAIDYFYNGKISREIHYANDKRNGYSDYYAPDGSFMYRLRFVENTLKGYTWKDLQGNYLPEKPVTAATTRFTTYYPNGKPSAHVELKNGLFHGKYQSFYANGNPFRHVTNENGDLVGEERFYYATGAIREVIHYVYDKRYGTYTLYYENGKKQLEGNYLENQRDGIWHVYDMAGRETATLSYFNGEMYDMQ